MLTIHHHDALVLAHERARDLCVRAAAERVRADFRRAAFAALLRRAANQLDPVPLVRATA